MFKLGQRWFSQAEPELGLGIVEDVIDRQVKIAYPAAETTRSYNTKTAPLKRHLLSVGELAEGENGEKFHILQIKENEGALIYLGEKEILPESFLKSDISLVKPHERVLAGNFDPNGFFNFRYESQLLKRALQTYSARGLEGSRASLLGHQVSIFQDVSSRISPRIVLADEVGLGKTIEAGMLAKRALEKGLADRILVLAPNALLYQWFFEFYKRFELLFKTLGAGDEVELSGKVDNDDLIISSLPYLLESGKDRALVLEKKWDLVIVDEAHRIKKGSEPFDLLQELVTPAKSAFFLSATPEALGEENFFELLKLLNPQKYTSYANYIAREKEFRSWEKLDPAKLDSYRYERDVFRNRRINLEKLGSLFPEKELNPIPISIDNPNDRSVLRAKAMELVRLIQENPAKKFLAIGKSRKLALETKKIILEELNLDVALFHGEQSLMERDRQAAYFADPEGANLLISAESGSEGRNFEFASELFFLDFPSHPLLALQRIGRLDRIGQKNKVSLHCPYILNTPEENIFTLYDKGFDLFNRFPTGLVEFYESKEKEIKEALGSPSKTKLEAIAQAYRKFQSEVEDVKNNLLDARSYSSSLVEKAREEILSFHRKNDLQKYLEKAFNFAGVNVEELSDKIYFAKPSDNMLLPSYPNLPAEGFSYTVDREIALKRDDLRFMSFESPLVKGTIDLFTEAEMGNATLALAQGKLGNEPCFEFIFAAYAKSGLKEGMEFFFPFTPIRALLSARGEDLTKKFPKRFIDEFAQDAPTELKENVSKRLPKETLLGLLSKASKLAATRLEKYREKAIEQINQDFDQEIRKLSALGEDNEALKLEKEKLSALKEHLIESAQKIETSFDSIRILL